MGHVQISYPSEYEPRCSHDLLIVIYNSRNVALDIPRYHPLATRVPGCLVEVHSSLTHFDTSRRLLSSYFIPLSMHTSPDMEAVGLRRFSCGGGEVLRVSTFGASSTAQDAHVPSESIPFRYCWLFSSSGLLR